MNVCCNKDMCIISAKLANINPLCRSNSIYNLRLLQKLLLGRYEFCPFKSHLWLIIVSTYVLINSVFTIRGFWKINVVNNSSLQN